MKHKIFVTQSSMPSYDMYCEEIKDLWDSRHLTNNGRKHQQLEKLLKEYLQIQNISLFTNGHAALQIALHALIPKGTEVITTPFTFASTVNAIVENGCIPVFCDIDPITYTIDASKLESLITKNTSAIVPVHVFGNICNVDDIQKIADKYQLKVIYDAAHVFGVYYKGKSIGAFGDISMLSFHATKVFHTIEGGALLYQDTSLYQKLNALKNFGLNEDGDMIEEGPNAKMSEFQAAMGICNLQQIDKDIEKRKVIVERYLFHLQGVKGIQLNQIQKDVKSNYAYFPIVIHQERYGINRDELYQLLCKEGIYCRKYFYPLVSDFEYYRKNYYIQKTPVASYIAQRVLCLPLYSELSLHDVDRICEIIKCGGDNV